MKKWVNVNWDEIKPGDVLKANYPDHPAGIFRCIVEHIGDKYIKAKGRDDLAGRYVYRGSRQAAVMFQRYEEVELPDDWYLVAFTSGDVVRYKKGSKMYYDNKGILYAGELEDYKILKRARFEELEE